MKPVALVGIAGGTCSGKSLVSKRLIEAVDPDRVLKLNQDSYYIDLHQMGPHERANMNFDHPSAFDMEQLRAHIEQLLQGEAIEEPVYNYVEHTRERFTRRREPRPIILLEGILVLDDAWLRDRMTFKVYVDEDADIRLARRLRRDEVERGRSTASILMQYEETVRPMHMQFVEPSKRYADVIIPHGGENLAGIEMLANHIRALIDQRAVNQEP